MRTLIIGTGISAASWVATAQRQHGEQRVAVGDRHLWQRLDPSHQMGQPRTLLTGQLLGERTARNRGFSAPARDGFMRTQDFADLVDERLQAGTAEVDRGWVTMIRPDLSRRFKYTVDINVPILGGKITVAVNRIIIATGPGPLRPLEIGASGREEAVNVSAMGGHVVTGDEFLAPEWRPPRTLLRRTVAIYGGSATAAWVAELAIARGYQVELWFVRPGDGKNGWNVATRFEGAFPAGARNRDVERDLAHVRRVLKPVKMRLLTTGAHAFVGLTVEGQDGNQIYVPDLLIYALGQGNTANSGIRMMLHDSIVIVPFFDANKTISDEQCLVAMGAEDKSLLIVGSGLHSLGATAVDKTTAYSSIASSLPPAARPPEGIALVMASIEAFNQYMPARPTGRQAVYTGGTHDVSFDWDINFNTCNRTQLAAYLAQTTDLAPFAANLAVELIIRIRTQRVNPFGITADYVAGICMAADRFWTDLKNLNFHLNKNPNDKRPGYDIRFHEVIAQEVIDSVFS